METFVLVLIFLSLALTTRTNTVHPCENPYQDLVKHPGWQDCTCAAKGNNYVLTRWKTSYTLQREGSRARLKVSGTLGKTIATWTPTEGWRFV